MKENLNKGCFDNIFRNERFAKVFAKNEKEEELMNMKRNIANNDDLNINKSNTINADNKEIQFRGSQVMILNGNTNSMVRGSQCMINNVNESLKDDISNENKNNLTNENDYEKCFVIYNSLG